MGYWGQLRIQDRISSVIKRLIFYHDESLLVIFFVLILVGFFLVIFVWRSKGTKGLSCGYIKRNEILETIWTFFPIFWLVLLGGPSLRILYSMEISDRDYGLRFKAVGHQWYWSYEYRYNVAYNVKGEKTVWDHFIIPEQNISFDSYIENIEDVIRERGKFRLLEVDQRVVCPSSSNIRVLVGSEDVIHCWTIPRLGVKVDAIPGRLNRVVFRRERVGVFYGQCSEICGANHSFIPIRIEIIPVDAFEAWWMEVSGWFEIWGEYLR